MKERRPRATARASAKALRQSGPGRRAAQAPARRWGTLPPRCRTASPRVLLCGKTWTQDEEQTQQVGMMPFVSLSRTRRASWLLCVVQRRLPVRRVAGSLSVGSAATSTNTAKPISATSAAGYGERSHDCGSNLSAEGLCWYRGESRRWVLAECQHRESGRSRDERRRRPPSLSWFEPEKKRRSVTT